MGAGRPSKNTDSVIAALLAKLADGQSLVTICADKKMPNAATIWRWSKADDELAKAILDAREIGYVLRGERAVENAKAAPDAVRGRLAFDAERWYLGKLSNAFADKTRHEHSGPDGDPIQHEHDLTEEAADAFTRSIAGHASRG